MVSARCVEDLRKHAMRGASGEFICACDAAEVHVYLQRGRIAWATDSEHRFAFASHLQEVAGIGAEEFRHVVEECRRDKLPLGETLVAWGLVSWEGVRRSLSHQIELALTLLTRIERGQAVFLERTYGSYDERLTFDLRDFVSAEKPSRPSAPAALPPMSDRPGLAQHVRRSIDGVLWVEVFDGERIVEAEPEVRGARLPAALVRTTLLDGADFVAMRSARSSVVGVGLSDKRSLWCRLSADSTFGSVVSAVASIAAPVDKAIEAPPPRPDVIAWAVGAHEPDDAIGAFMHRANDVLGAIVLDGDSASDPIAGCGSSALGAEPSVDIARRRARSFQGTHLPADREDKELGSMGFFLREMVTGERACWCFGAELDPSTGHTLWLFLDRRTSQGLGWAYLSALARTLRSAREVSGR